MNFSRPSFEIIFYAVDQTTFRIYRERELMELITELQSANITTTQLQFLATAGVVKLCNALRKQSKKDHPNISQALRKLIQIWQQVQSQQNAPAVAPPAVAPAQVQTVEKSNTPVPKTNGVSNGMSSLESKKLKLTKKLFFFLTKFAIEKSKKKVKKANRNTPTPTHLEATKKQESPKTISPAPIKVPKLKISIGKATPTKNTSEHGEKRKASGNTESPAKNFKQSSPEQPIKIKIDRVIS